jgi:hypothetical protein
VVLCRPVSGRPLLLAVLIVVVSTHASAVTTWRGTIATDTGLSGAIRVGRLSSGHDCFGSESGRFWCRGPACPGRRGVFGIDRPDYGRPNPPYTVDVEWIFLQKTRCSERSPCADIGCGFLHVIDDSPVSNCTYRGHYTCYLVGTEIPYFEGTADLKSRSRFCRRLLRAN